ncbi:hypothetical protein AB0331_13900 [Dietzia maris]
MTSQVPCKGKNCKRTVPVTNKSGLCTLCSLQAQLPSPGKSKSADGPDF